MFIQATDKKIYKNPVLQEKNKICYYPDDLTMKVMMKGLSKNLGNWNRFLDIIETEEKSILWTSKRNKIGELVPGIEYTVIPIGLIPVDLIISNSGIALDLTRQVYIFEMEYTINELEKIRNDNDEDLNVFEKELKDRLKRLKKLYPMKIVKKRNKLILSKLG